MDLPSGYELPLDPSGRVKNFLVVLMNFVLVCLIQPNETFLSVCHLSLPSRDRQTDRQAYSNTLVHTLVGSVTANKYKKKDVPPKAQK